MSTNLGTTKISEQKKYTNNLKILDCTLRDGGYINNWEFGEKTAEEIIYLLNKAGIDLIETGFLSAGAHNKDKTLFNTFDDINRFIPNNVSREKLVAMIKYGNFPIEKVPNTENAPVKGIRLIFKKNQKKEALAYCRELKSKGYNLFINPTFIDEYYKNEIIELLNDINNIMPFGFTIVDSTGSLNENDLDELYAIIDKNLNESITICLHSHNNLELSYTNAKKIIDTPQKRNIIMDSTILGMGRGAGNLCTEQITEYINIKYGNRYTLTPIHKIIEKIIKPIFSKTPWGCTPQYRISALNHCHPNYATYLVNLKKVSIEKLDELLKYIPDPKKSTYDEFLIEQIFNQHTANL